VCVGVFCDFVVGVDVVVDEEYFVGEVGVVCVGCCVCFGER